MSDTWNKTTGYNSSVIENLHTSVGTLEDGTGTGDWVSAKEVLQDLWASFDPRTITYQSIYMNIFRNTSFEQTVGALGTGQKLTLRIEGRLKPKKGSANCKIPVQKRLAKTITVGSDESLVSGEVFDCACPEQTCGNLVPLHSPNQIARLSALHRREIALSIDEEFATKIKALTFKAVSTAGKTYYEQGINQIKEVRKALGRLPFSAGNYVFMVDEEGAGGLELTDPYTYKYNYDQTQFDKMLELGLIGYIQSIPVIQVPASDMADANSHIQLVSALHIGFVGKCTREYIKEGVATETDGIDEKSYYGIRVNYGFYDLQAMYPEYINVKGIALVTA